MTSDRMLNNVIIDRAKKLEVRATRSTDTHSIAVTDVFLSVPPTPREDDRDLDLRGRL